MFLGTVEDGAPSDASLLLLSSFFGQKLLNQSLELVDSVVKVACASSGRAFFRIQGNDATPYLVISSFCTCRAFEGHTRLPATNEPRILATGHKMRPVAKKLFEKRSREGGCKAAKMTLVPCILALIIR